MTLALCFGFCIDGRRIFFACDYLTHIVHKEVRCQDMGMGLDDFSYGVH
jgi:hypothetical protein